MFTGIIEALGTIEAVKEAGSNRIFEVSSSLSEQLKVDQSVSHNGVCLTVEAISGNTYQVTAVAETLQKSNAGYWKAGTLVNLERSLLLGSRLDGHLVQGHVDCTGTCAAIEDHKGSWNITIHYPEKFAALLIEKGSIALNGISLTVFNVGNHSFTVTIIPYTWEHTHLHQLKPGDAVNLEFDMLGKYAVRAEALRRKQ